MTDGYRWWVIIEKVGLVDGGVECLLTHEWFNPNTVNHGACRLVGYFQRIARPFCSYRFQLLYE